VRKLKVAEVKTVRDTLAHKQGWVCVLCSSSLKQKDPVLDHCHDTGTVRAVLCRNCNGMEGKIRSASIRAASREGMINWLENLAAYWRHFEDNPRPLTYPTHKTEAEKRVARNKKARTVRATAKKESK